MNTSFFQAKSSIRCIRKTVLISLIFTGWSTLSHAQFVVYDPAQFANMLQSIAQQAKQAITLGKTLSETKNILQQAKATKQEIERLHKLHQDAREALKMAKGIVDLKWSDLDLITSKALSVSIDPHIFMPDIEGTDALRRVLQSAPNSAAARELYGLLSTVNSFKGVTSFAQFEQKANEALVNQYAFSEMSDQKMIQTALSFNTIAEDMISQANELIEAVKRDKRFSMNEAERISTLKSCQDVLLQSFELKLQADKLMRTTIENQTQSTQAARQSYKNALFRKALAQTPQIKFGK
jgi:hypothetical protein